MPLAPAAGRKALASPMHQFRAGERLSLTAVFGDGRKAANCNIVSLIPFEGYGLLRYRVRSDSEEFERIVPEGDLYRS